MCLSQNQLRNPNYYLQTNQNRFVGGTSWFCLSGFLNPEQESPCNQQ